MLSHSSTTASPLISTGSLLPVYASLSTTTPGESPAMTKHEPRARHRRRRDLGTPRAIPLTRRAARVGLSRERERRTPVRRFARANHFVANPFVANGFVVRYFAAGGGGAGNVTFGAGANGTMPNFGYASDG